MRWEVNWTAEAQNMLAEIWLNSSERNQISTCADEAEVLLKYSTAKQIKLLSEGLWFFDKSPLRFYLEIDLNGNQINIVAVGYPPAKSD